MGGEVKWHQTLLLEKEIAAKSWLVGCALFLSVPNWGLSDFVRFMERAFLVLFQIVNPNNYLSPNVVTESYVFLHPLVFFLSLSEWFVKASFLSRASWLHGTLMGRAPLRHFNQPHHRRWMSYWVRPKPRNATCAQHWWWSWRSCTAACTDWPRHGFEGPR